MPKPKKTGKPRALDDNPQDEPSLEEFIEQMHGDDALSQPQSGLPPLPWLKQQFKTKSAAIRYLTNQGHAVKTIAKHLGVRYQMVRNIAHNPLKRGPNESWQPKQEPPRESSIPIAPPTTKSTQKGGGENQGGE